MLRRASTVVVVFVGIIAVAASEPSPQPVETTTGELSTSVAVDLTTAAPEARFSVDVGNRVGSDGDGERHLIVGWTRSGETLPDAVGVADPETGTYAVLIDGVSSVSGDGELVLRRPLTRSLTSSRSSSTSAASPSSTTAPTLRATHRCRWRPFCSQKNRPASWRPTGVVNDGAGFGLAEKRRHPEALDS